LFKLTQTRHILQDPSRESRWKQMFWAPRWLLCLSHSRPETWSTLPARSRYASPQASSRSLAPPTTPAEGYTPCISILEIMPLKKPVKAWMIINCVPSPKETSKSYSCHKQEKYLKTSFLKSTSTLKKNGQCIWPLHKSLNDSFKKHKLRRLDPVVQAYNPGYFGGRDGEEVQLEATPGKKKVHKNPSQPIKKKLKERLRGLTLQV
jgi:hypothetical protein